VTTLPPLLTVGIALVPRSALPLSALLALLAVVTFSYALIGSICVMLDYPILVRTISVGIRGRMFAILTTAYGVFAILIGLLSARVLKNVAYPMGYAWCFLAALVSIVLCAASFRKQRELPELAVPGASRSALPFTAIWDVLGLQEFWWLAGPHVLRGLGSGLAGFAIPMGLRYLGLPEETPGYATSANYAAGVLGGLALGLIADRWGAGRSTLLGDLLLALGMGTMMLRPSLPLFLVLYFLLHFGRNIEDSAVPFGTTLIVPPEHMGAFSAARLMILQGSSAVGSRLFGRWFERYSPVWLFGLGAAMKVINGVWFWWVFQLKPPVPREKGIQEW
jgi:MFS family permease